MTLLHPVIEADLQRLQQTLNADGTLLPPSALQPYYDAFRRRFGPDALRQLDGPALLELMHAHGNRDSLVYWLEFKDDDEFPARFGSILGGSALKFGVYKRKETGTWAKKESSAVPVNITEAEAVIIAERHRDQLLAAVEVLNRFAGASDATDDARYLALQAELAHVAPAVQDSAWGHKYLALLFPNVLDDFHAESYQRWNLVRALQIPPHDGAAPAEGRYVCAGRFVALARELDLPLNTLTTLLGRRNGTPRAYWRVGTTDDERARRKYWPMMRDYGLVAIGWAKIGDLAGRRDEKETKEAIAALVATHYPADKSVVGRAASQIFQFYTRMADGDRVLAADGQTVIGIGEIAGPYAFDSSLVFAHRRPVNWRSHAEWQPPSAEALRTTVRLIRDHGNQVQVERHILDDAKSVSVVVGVFPVPALDPPSPNVVPVAHTGRLPRMTGTPGAVQQVLERKGQVILYGPPGTGKTYMALRSVRELAAQRTYGTGFEQLDPAQRARITEGTLGEPPLVRVTSFHPEYGYEDFVEGYRPKATVDGHLGFTLIPGVFRRVCSDAERTPNLDFFLVIDEINRGDVPRIFGELLTLLERDKRGQAVTLATSGETFRVPMNVYVVGTMNTADRSIALLDVALRRRFGFVELMPDYSLFANVAVGGLPLGAWLEDLNMRVRRLGGGDARNRQVGHAFLLGPQGPITTPEQFAAVLRDDIVPLLEEYCYDDFSQLGELLGKTLVNVAEQRVYRNLFDAGREADLINALKRPEIATAAAAILVGVAVELADDAVDAAETGVDDTSNGPPQVGA